MTDIVQVSGFTVKGLGVTADNRLLVFGAAYAKCSQAPAGDCVKAHSSGVRKHAACTNRALEVLIEHSIGTVSA